MGARGNSGVITSQIFRGFSQALEGKEEINALDLAYAFDNGRKVAYKAVIKPVEGTILTVIRESSSYLLEKVDEKTSLEEAFDLILKEAKASLSRTPNLLPVLKEVGVVDSGGAGLVKILEGMSSAIHGEFIEKNAATVIDTKNTDLEVDNDIVNYEVDFTLKLGPSKTKKPYQKTRFSSVISGHGTNVSIDENENIIKVHVKTQNIGEIISFAQNYGEFASLNVKSSIAPIEDNTSNKTEANNIEENKEEEYELINDYALVATSSGPGIDKFFHDVGVNYIVPGGQTMNPSTEDFLKIIKETKAKVVYVFPNNGNIILAANQAKDVLKGKVDVVVIPTKTIMQGIVGSMMFTPDVSKKENIKNMEEQIKAVKSGSVTFAIKDTDINGVHVGKDEFMGIRESKDIIFSNPDKMVTFKTLVEKIVDEDSAIITVILGKDITSEEEKEVNNYLNEKYKDFDLDVRRGDQPIYSFLIGVE